MDNIFFTIMILSLLALTMLGITQSDLKQIQSQTKTYQGALCAKEINGQTANLIDDISKTNQILAALKAGEITTIIIPKLKILFKMLTKGTKKALMLYQIKRLSEYRIDMFQLRKKHCYLSPSTYKTPYKFSILNADRDKLDRIKKRNKNKWQINAIGGNLKIQSRYFYGNKKSQTNLLKLAMPWQ